MKKQEIGFGDIGATAKLLDQERAKVRNARSVSFGAIGAPLPPLASIQAEPVDRRPKKHARGFSERLLGREILPSVQK